MGRRPNKLRNTAGLIGLFFFRHECRIFEIAHICSRTRSEDQCLYAKVQFILVPPLSASALSLRFIWRRHWDLPPPPPPLATPMGVIA